MSDFVMFMIVGAALGVVALLSVITWILILHKSHTEWRLAADNCRFASPLWNETLDDRAACATAIARPLHANCSWTFRSLIEGMSCFSEKRAIG